MVDEPIRRPAIADFQSLKERYWQSDKPAAEARGLLYEAADRSRWRISSNKLLSERIDFLVSVARLDPVRELDESLRLTARQQIARNIIADLCDKSLAGEGGFGRRDRGVLAFRVARETSAALVVFYAQSPGYVAGLSKSEVAAIHKMLELFWVDWEDVDRPELVSAALVNTFALELIREHQVIGALGHLVKLLNGRLAINLFGDELLKQTPDNIITILDQLAQYQDWNPNVGPVRAHDVVATITYLLPVLRSRHLQYLADAAERA